MGPAAASTGMTPTAYSTISRLTAFKLEIAMKTLIATIAVFLMLAGRVHAASGYATDCSDLNDPDDASDYLMCINAARDAAIQALIDRTHPDAVPGAKFGGLSYTTDAETGEATATPPPLPVYQRYEDDKHKRGWQRYKYFVEEMEDNPDGVEPRKGFHCWRGGCRWTLIVTWDEGATTSTADDRQLQLSKYRWDGPWAVTSYHSADEDMVEYAHRLAARVTGQGYKLQVERDERGYRHTDPLGCGQLISINSNGLRTEHPRRCLS